MSQAPMNRYGVGLQGDTIVLLFPPRRLTPSEALALAAWLVALAEPMAILQDSDANFQSILDAVLKS